MRLRWGLVALLALFAVLQLVPYGRSHENPPVKAEPRWDARTAELARVACMDCHSNQTAWPWYSNIAPVSWLVQHDVDSGRDHINFSEWGVSAQEEAEELGEVLGEGEMPPWFYPLMHPEAKLTSTERAELTAGLQRIAPPRSGSAQDVERQDD